MKILVAVKHVVDVELNIKIKDNAIDLEGMQYVMSAWDENAVEAAVVLKEDNNAETTVVSIGDDEAQVTIRKAFAMGIESGIHVNDASLLNQNSIVYAKTLKAVYEKGDYDLILIGRQSQDTDNCQTGGMLSELLDLPSVSNAIAIEFIDDKKLSVQRQSDQGKEVTELTLPAVITVNDSLNEPRLASLRGIMQAKKKTIETFDLGGLGLDPETAGITGSESKVTEILPPEQRAAGQKFEGDVAEITAKVVGLLANEAKVI